MHRPQAKSEGHPVVSTYENNGLLYGALLGVLLGVLIAGPQLFQWSIEKNLATIVVSSAIIGGMGHLAVWLAFSVHGARPGVHDAEEDNDDLSCDGTYASDD